MNLQAVKQQLFIYCMQRDAEMRESKLDAMFSSRPSTAPMHAWKPNSDDIHGLYLIFIV